MQTTDPYWVEQFRRRMGAFGEAPTVDVVPVSVRVRVSSGCFHREHSPEAYRLIDRYLADSPDLRREARFEEHESGPEILTYAAMATAGLSLTANIINLVVAILKARSEGVRRGDSPRDPLEVIVRRIDGAGDYQEEMILRIPAGIEVDHVSLTKEFLKRSKPVGPQSTASKKKGRGKPRPSKKSK